MISSPQEECSLNIRQEFLVTTTVHKAKGLPIFNVDTYVRVSLENKSKSTKVFQNSENPYYNEYFVFELSCTLAELLRLTVLYEVKKKTCCKVDNTLGELLIDLHTVWSQPTRSFFKKWGKLENPIDSQSGAKGHLQIDLAIVSPQQPTAPAIISSGDCDDIENNLLQNLDTSPCNIKYNITIYSGVFAKKSDYIIQVSLAGMSAKTTVRKGSALPEWNEQVTFNWTFPSPAQTFLLQVMAHDHLHWKCIALSEIYFDEISFNDTPSLGPTYIQLYDFNIYVGRLLIEIKSEKLQVAKESLSRAVAMKPTQPLAEKSWWANETFIVEFVTWQGEFVHANASNMKMLVKLGEFTSDNVECFLKNYTGTSAPWKYFTQDPPFKAAHIKCSLADSRLKYESDNFMVTLVEQIKSEMENFKLFQLKYPRNKSIHCKCLKAIILSILGKLQDSQTSTRLQYNGFKQQTAWDVNRLAYIKDFFSRLEKSLKELRRDLKKIRDEESSCDKVFQKLLQLRGEIESIIQTRIQDEWPELHLLMCASSGKGSAKEFAICKLNARHFIYCQRAECRGRWCGIPRNFVFKDTNCAHTCQSCGCTRGFVYGWLRIATEAEQSDFLVSADWEQKEKFYYQPKVEPSNYVCRVYVHQAKIQPGADKTGMCDAKVRVLAAGEMEETSTIYTSLSPVWSESVSFASRKMPGDLTWYEKNPPLLAVQVYDIDSRKSDDYLGCGLVELSVQKLSNRKEPLKSLMESCAETALSQTTTDISSFQSSMTRFHSRRTAIQKLNELRFLSPPLLKWVPIAIGGASRVEVLMSGELLQVNEGEAPDGMKSVLVKGIPKDIQPVMARYLFEVTFVGLRSCQKLSCFSLGRFKIHVMIGELLLKSGVSGNRLKNSINFLESYASGVVALPQQFEYWPAIIATHIDCPGRSREVTLGASLVPNPTKYLDKQEVTCDFAESEESTIVQVGETDEENAPLLPPRSILKKGLFVRLKQWLRKLLTFKSRKATRTPSVRVDESEYNWWTKFYNSMYINEKNIDVTLKHKLVIYPSELEKEPDFSYLSDWAESFPLAHGVKNKKNMPPKEEVYATLKMHIKLSPCQCNNASSVTLNSVASVMSSRLKSQSLITEQTKIFVRVYLVQGLQLRSHDNHSQSDSYVKLQLGTQTISDRAHYMPNQSNPIFGKRFQMEAVIPKEHILQVSVFDRGGVCDNLIGSTFIDLEDRLRSKHRATVGIANEFNRSGYNMWRDAMTPYEILKDVCKTHRLRPPIFEKNSVELDGVLIEDDTVISTDEDLQERLSLSVLKKIHEIPSVGYHFVPEHVETRSLYRPDKPGVEQGKLQLWIEIYDTANLPPPIDITPTPARLYELRIIVHNCSDVVSNEKNVFGTKMSDIYIKAWCEDSEVTQSTDVHYRSLNGEGNFNWRMIFPIKYSTTEDMMVIKRKDGLLEQHETKQPPIVYLQIWENDSFSADDFMAAMEICLSNFPEPFDVKKKCTESQMKKRKSINLFRDKTIKGWFPCKGPPHKSGSDGIAGKLELELEILIDTEAVANPVGFGRNPPKALPAPERPEESFNPWTNPIKSLKNIILPALKKCCCYSLLIVIAVFALILLVEDLPNFIMGIFHSF